MSIRDFKAKFSDIARQNRYKVECVKLPFAKDFVINCNLPGQSFGSGDYRNPDQGPIPLKLPNDIIQNQLSLTFLVDSEYKVKKDIDAWYFDIFNSGQNGADMGFGYFEDYAADITIICMDRANNPVYNWRVEKAYPMAISDAQMGWDQTNTGVQFTVSFDHNDLIPS